LPRAFRLIRNSILTSNTVEALNADTLAPPTVK